jgi:dienelactone hydrolase
MTRCCRRGAVRRCETGPRRTAGRPVRCWVGILVLVCACAAIAPPAPPRGSANAERLAAARFDVGRRDYTFVDASRPNGARDGAHARKRRTLVTTVWFPRGALGPHPLVLYSHGYFATRRGGAYLAEWLASRGYVVAAPDHPLTRRSTAHGRTVGDVVHQPADLSFVIDQILGWNDGDRPFDGAVDPQRIGVMGLSLGGMTATLAAFHPRLRDARIRAAVSIAGPMTIFGTRFFADAPIPFLMLAGDGDVVIDYATNAPLVLERVPDGRLVAIHGGNHVGFDDSSTGVLRALPNPDAEACWFLFWTLDLSRSRDTLAALGGPEAGLVVPSEIPRPCSAPAPFTAMSPVRQHLIAQLAVGAFFDSVFAPDEAARAAALSYLREDLGRDFPEARYADRTAGSPARLASTSQTTGGPSRRRGQRAMPGLGAAPGCETVSRTAAVMSRGPRIGRSAATSGMQACRGSPATAHAPPTCSPVPRPRRWRLGSPPGRHGGTHDDSAGHCSMGVRNVFGGHSHRT